MFAAEVRHRAAWRWQLPSPGAPRRQARSESGRAIKGLGGEAALLPNLILRCPSQAVRPAWAGPMTGSARASKNSRKLGPRCLERQPESARFWSQNKPGARSGFRRPLTPKLTSANASALSLAGSSRRSCLFLTSRSCHRSRVLCAHGLLDESMNQSNAKRSSRPHQPDPARELPIRDGQPCKRKTVKPGRPPVRHE